MQKHYDDSKARQGRKLEGSLPDALPGLIAAAQALPGYAEALAGVRFETIKTRAALSRLPVLRRTVLRASQMADPPFGGFSVTPLNGLHYILRSPGPIYGPGPAHLDWSRVGHFLKACGVGPGDVVQNCFDYHLSPWGPYFDMAARAVGATVLPAGATNADRQVQAAVDLGCAVYAGCPAFLSELLDTADHMRVTLPYQRAAVAGGMLLPAQRTDFARRGIRCQQGYVTPELGCIAYETAPADGMTVDSGVIVEIVTPGTGDPVPDGELGEVLVTTLNPLAPLIRFATGDLSRTIAEPEAGSLRPLRIAGFCGRADQMIRINDLFVRPEQVAELVARHPEIRRARMIASRAGDADQVTLLIEAAEGSPDRYYSSLSQILMVQGVIELVAPGSLPKDGKVIDDQRTQP